MNLSSQGGFGPGCDLVNFDNAPAFPIHKYRQGDNNKSINIGKEITTAQIKTVSPIES